jgi:uncharacterized membrane protein
MEGKAKFLGHSVHPILIVFPLGLLATAVIFDVIYLIWGNTLFATVSYWMMAAGIIGGLIAAPFGLIDWISIPSGTRAKSVGLIHGIVNVLTVGVFLVSWYLRSGAPERPPMAASALGILGLVMALVGGWLGGELVERLGVGVHPGANPDAPSSLSTDAAHIRGAHPHRP